MTISASYTGGMEKQSVPATTVRGDIFYVDSEDFEWVCKFKWYMSPSRGLIYRRGPNEGGNSTARSKDRRRNRSHISTPSTKVRPYRPTFYLARVLTNAPDDMVVGYKDRNPLNLTKSNLLLQTKQARAQRKQGNSNTSSEYRGVYLSNKIASKPWQAYIKYEDKVHYIGVFRTEREAAVAWNLKAREVYGLDCYQNAISPLGTS
jgi:hypothetical protein